MFVHVCRAEVEEQNNRSLAMFQKSATLHSEEVKRFQENLFRQRGLAEQYSQRITELEQGKAGLEAELLDVRARMERAMQEASIASREVGGLVGRMGSRCCGLMLSACCGSSVSGGVSHLTPRSASSCTEAGRQSVQLCVCVCVCVRACVRECVCALG